jgi:hypothetical protein
MRQRRRQHSKNKTAGNTMGVRRGGRPSQTVIECAYFLVALKVVLTFCEAWSRMPFTSAA